jgi:hypothetical protein
MEFMDPRGVPSRAIEPYELTAELNEGDTVALFANGFPDSVAFLEHVEKSLSHELPGVDFLHLDKGNASAPASAEHLSAIAESCVAVVAAYGH